MRGAIIETVLSYNTLINIIINTGRFFLSSSSNHFTFKCREKRSRRNKARLTILDEECVVSFQYALEEKNRQDYAVNYFP